MASTQNKSVPAEWIADPAIASRLAHHFQQHILNLQIVFQLNGEKACAVYTGFLVQYKGDLYWVTAGHVVSEVRDILADTRTEVGGAGFVDGFRPDADHIRVTLDDLRDQPVAVNGEGLDLAFWKLRTYYRNQILANSKLVPLEERIWASRPADWIPDGYYLVGTPNEWNRTEFIPESLTSDKVRAQMTCACVPVKRVPDRSTNDNPLSSFWGVEHAFYGELGICRDAEFGDLNDIRGTSGGLLLSMEHLDTGELRYYLIGVQSAWLPDSRILRATLAEYIPAMIDVAHKSVVDVK